MEPSPNNGLKTEEDKENVRRAFRRMSFILPILARFGKAGRMSASEAASINIELNEITGDLTSSYDDFSCPTAFVIASGGSFGAPEDAMQEMRSTLARLIGKHPNISLFSEVPCNHLQVLNKAADDVASAILNISGKIE